MSIEQLLSIKGAVVLTCLLLLFIAERLRPAAIRAEQYHDMARVGRNLSLWGLNALFSPLLVIPMTALVSEGVAWRFSWLNGWPGILVGIVVLDLWIYGWHRLNHVIPVFWRFHRVHHLDEWLDVSTSVRFHFGEVIFSAMARIPIVWIMGMPLVSVIIFETLVLMMSGFQHSNLRLPVRFEQRMSKVFITPSIHWVHHHVLRSDTNSNYVTLFSFWDRLFGSRSNSRRELDMAIGLDDSRETSLIGLLASPFGKQRE